MNADIDEQRIGLSNESDFREFPKQKYQSTRSPQKAQSLQPDHSILSPQSLKSPSNFCYGRIKDLEQMVPSNWWHQIFGDEMYLKTDGDVVEDHQITLDEIQMLRSYNSIWKKLSQVDGKVLDLCCGQGRHAIQLAKEFPHLKICGHDQSEFLINLAKTRNLQSNLVNFSVGDCRVIPYEDNYFDLLIVMGNSFGYFKEDEFQLEALQEMYRVLKCDGVLVLDLTDGDFMKANYSKRSWEWIDDSSFVCRERQLSQDGKRLISREVIANVIGGVERDQFYQERLYSEQEIWNLIEPLGFKRNLSASLKTEGMRNEDLGMMAFRILITATKKEPSIVYEKEPAISIQNLPILIPKLTVLLGDPRIPCTGKLNNSWNVEDLITRQKLFDALTNLNFNFSIIDNHIDLLHSFHKDQFVFNLCDEGFKNVATNELHVPAILEMIGVKYTGAGPACLAFCYDKQATNSIAKALEIPVPNEVYYSLDDYTEKNIQFPAFVKPIKGDNSLGITIKSIVHNTQQLDDFVRSLSQELGIREVIVQEYLEGMEFSVGIIGNEDNFHVLPILQVDFSLIEKQGLPPILGFESKWDPTSPYWSQISYKLATPSGTLSNFGSVEKYCKLLFSRLGCKDYARFDFRADRFGVIKLLEVNPNPGWCWDGKLNYMAKLEGWSYETLLGEIIKVAYLRLYK